MNCGPEECLKSMSWNETTSKVYYANKLSCTFLPFPCICVEFLRKETCRLLQLLLGREIEGLGKGEGRESYISLHKSLDFLHVFLLIILKINFKLYVLPYSQYLWLVLSIRITYFISYYSFSYLEVDKLTQHHYKC